MKKNYNSKEFNKALNVASKRKGFSLTMQEGILFGFISKGASVTLKTPHTSCFSGFDLIKFEEGWKIEDGYHVSGAIKTKLSFVNSGNSFCKHINEAVKIADLSKEQIKTIKTMYDGTKDIFRPFIENICIKEDGFAYYSNGKYLIKANWFPNHNINIHKDVLSVIPDMDCQVLKHEDKVILNFDDTMYITMYCNSDVRPPDYNEVIPFHAENKTAINAKSLIKAIDIVSPACNKHTNVLQFTENKVVAEDVDLGKRAVTDTELSFEYDIRLNSKYLKTIMKCVGDCEVSCREGKQLLFTNNKFTAILVLLN